MACRPVRTEGKEGDMKRAMLALGLVVLVASGCVSVREIALHEELAYKLDPVEGRIPATDKVIAVLPFDDERFDNTAELSTSPCWNLVPFVCYTTQLTARPELRYKTTSSGLFHKVVITGTLADAIPRLLVDHLKQSGRASNAVYGEPPAVEGKAAYDYVVRGAVVGSALSRKRYTYGLGPLAVIPYLFFAPTSRYTACLEVEWQLFDAAGKPIGQKALAAVEYPMEHSAGLLYGGSVSGKNAPAGMYIEAVKAVNEQIAFRISELIGK